MFYTMYRNAAAAAAARLAINREEGRAYDILCHNVRALLIFLFASSKTAFCFRHRQRHWYIYIVNYFD